MILLAVALAPVFILLLYIYFRDKYDKEPVGLLLKGLFLGAFITIPIVFMEGFFTAFGKDLTGVTAVAYKSFVVAGFTEELFKYMAVMFLFWRHRAFDERFDGIVYAAFVSLGFAAVENILYVFEHGTGTGILRAVTAVPGHLLFGVTMGYYIGLARFMPEKKSRLLFRALFIPVFLHGFYNFMLFSGHPLMLILFVPFIIYLWRTGLKKMKSLSIPHEQFSQDMESDGDDPPVQRD